ncbi:hypothetical protein Y032_0003g1202 [Ancylostoma ceylanicum]|uniref:Lecithin:cholesterol acyltransferase n=1 Tax=Ancylostoma ceylanicum TaxID=53326 RepID=A0A016VWM5_9BILA|nr:hypothetical protein Y032_0003g1202 [Ancylostoma ceylanicum]
MMHRMFVLLVFLRQLWFAGADVGGFSHPVILIPGIGGSQMEANLTGKPHVVNPFCLRHTTKYFDIWLNLEELLPIAIDCFVHNMMLQTNPENGMVSNMPGVDIRVSGFGTSAGVEFVDKSRIAPGMYFFLLVENLVKWGFRRDVSILGAPYDYRVAPEELGEYYLRLRKLIEKAYIDALNNRVVVIGHSLGNIIALHLFTRIVDQAWKDKYIKAFVTIGAPWAGSMKALKGYTSGHNFEAPNFFLPPMKLRPGQRTYTSLASLFPTRMAWKDDEVLATVGSTNYTLADMPQFFTRLEYEMAWKQVQRLGTLDKTLPAPGVRVYCIFGVGLPTTSRLIWTNKSFPHEQPKEIRDRTGDGTVEERSADLCRHWNPGNNAGKKVTLHRIRGANHMHTIHHPTTVEIIRQVVISPNTAASSFSIVFLWISSWLSL